MNWPWSKSDYSNGSIIIENEELNSIIAASQAEAWIDDEYEHFLLPSYELFQQMDAKYWDSSWIKYGYDAPDFPLCYDFAELWSSKMREASIRENFKSRPACGTIRYTKNSGERHSIGFFVCNDKKIRYREPQPTDNPWMETPDDMKSIENFDI